MSKNNKILIGVLILLVAVFLLVRHSRDHRERRTRLFNIDPEEIAFIEMKTTRDTLIFSRDAFDQSASLPPAQSGVADGWSIEYPFLFEIDTIRLDKFFEEVLPVQKSNTPVALSEESFPEYQVTEERGTILNFYDHHDRLLDSVIIGRSGRFSYARRPDDNEVYQLTENVSFMVNPNLDSWRSNKIISVPRGQIESIEAVYELNQYTLNATDSLWLFNDDNHRFSVRENNDAMRQLLSKIERMNSFAYKDFQYEEYQDILQNPQLILKINMIDGSDTSLLFAHLKEDNNFLVQKDDMAEHLYIVDPETVDLFTKSPQHFQS